MRLQIPNDAELMIDLQQACVILMCHIDRLVSPYLPSLSEPRIGSAADTSASTSPTSMRNSSEVGRCMTVARYSECVELLNHCSMCCQAKTSSVGIKL